MKKYQICLLILSALLLLLSMALSLFVWLESPKTVETLIDTSTLKVTQEGNKIAVIDVLSDRVYTFYIKHRSSSERHTEAITVSKPGANIVVKVAKKRIILLDGLNNKNYVLRIGRIFPQISLN